MAVAHAGDAGLLRGLYAEWPSHKLARDRRWRPSIARKPFIVGIGGTVVDRSSTEQALDYALQASQRAGASVATFGGSFLTELPHYLSRPLAEVPRASEFLDAIRAADGLIIASPAYHGSISGLVKNAIDYIEETARDGDRPYLDGVPVGLIVTAHGWQATGSTLSALRSIIHALRGWPTPLGAGLNVIGGMFRDGECSDDGARRQLELIGRQVLEFARMRLANPSAVETSIEP